MSLIQVAKKINRQGDLYIRKNGIKEFHKKAAELLAASDLSKSFNFEEIVQSAFDNKHPQHFKTLEFSDLPVTIAQGENCFIDVYFWRRRPTVIHNHHFTGAFLCLTGSNVDLEFTFKRERKLGKFHDLGSIELKHSRNILPGDIAEIPFMDKFIHQNHHQAELTVNLCFRTPQDGTKSLSNYLYSGLRYEKNNELLGRVARLMRFVDLGAFNPEKVNINNDDAINFLIQNYDSRSQNPRLVKLRTLLEKRIKKELGIEIPKLIKEHDLKMEEIENDYE